MYKRQHAADGQTPWDNPLKPKNPPLPAKAKHVIFLFMYGGPSQVDTFDYKPKMYPLDGKTIEVKTFGRGGKKNGGRVVGPNGSSNNMASAVNTFLISSHISGNNPTRSLICTR